MYVRNNIKFLKKMEIYKRYDKEVADKALKKFINHLWYLNEECAALSIFNENLSYDTRKKMADRILHEELKKDAQKYIIKFEDVQHFLSKYLPLSIKYQLNKHL
jgi:hypothetical protein